MLPTPKTRGKLISLAAIAAVSAVLLLYRTEERARHLIEHEVVAYNAIPSEAKEDLAQKAAVANKQYPFPDKYGAISKRIHSEPKGEGSDCCRDNSLPAFQFPEGLTQESVETQKIFYQMFSEKRRWDDYQKTKYATVLDSTTGPLVHSSQALELVDENNRKLFLRLENALNLHKRLIRDVRLFHAEIQFQKKQREVNEPYELFDLKFQLAPFAFETALVDALQQAMSALSVGIYQEEAIEVLNRIGDELTQPIQALNRDRADESQTPLPQKYIYNLYTLYGKKLMRYADGLTRQTVIAIGPTAFGELDYFNRRMFEHLSDLYMAGVGEAIDPAVLDLDELERVLYFGE